MANLNPSTLAVGIVGGWCGLWPLGWACSWSAWWVASAVAFFLGSSLLFARAVLVGPCPDSGCEPNLRRLFVVAFDLVT